MCASPSLSSTMTVFMSLILLSEALFFPLNQFPPWGLIKLNWIELNMSWSRYEDVKAVWHLFSHIEIKYNVLILNASDRINRNDLRFFPPSRVLQTHPNTHTHAHSHALRLCHNCFGWGWWKLEYTHSSNSLFQKCCLCSVKSAGSCGRKTVPSLSALCVGSKRKCNSMLCVVVVFPDD